MKRRFNFTSHVCLLGMLLCSWVATQAQAAIEAWVQRYNNPDVGSQDYALKIVTDTTGNAIVAGYTDDGFTGQDILVIKCSGEGVPLWTNRYNSLADERVNAVAVDASGNVFVAGNFTVVGYSSTGVMLWTNRFGALASALAVGGDGSVFVTGTFDWRLHDGCVFRGWSAVVD